MSDNGDGDNDPWPVEQENCECGNETFALYYDHRSQTRHVECDECGKVLPSV